MDDQSHVTRNTQHVAPDPDVSDLQATSYKLQATEYLAGWKRAQADYQNLKKETERERAEFMKYANERLLHDLLPMIDQLSLALKHLPTTQDLPEERRKVLENWLTGL